MALDADLINPTLDRRFGIPNQRELSNLIVGDVDFTVFTCLKEYSYVSVITTGPIPPNSSELFRSAGMKQLMDRLRDEYDVMIMDSPLILPVTDADVAVVGLYCVGILAESARHLLWRILHPTPGWGAARYRGVADIRDAGMLLQQVVSDLQLPSQFIR